jgi:hypothetical protein
MCRNTFIYRATPEFTPLMVNRKPAAQFIPINIIIGIIPIETICLILSTVVNRQSNTPGFGEVVKTYKNHTSKGLAALYEMALCCFKPFAQPAYAETR